MRPKFTPKPKCFFHDKAGECWGKLEEVPGVTHFIKKSTLWTCRGHAEILTGGIYQPETRVDEEPPVV